MHLPDSGFSRLRRTCCAQGAGLCRRGTFRNGPPQIGVTSVLLCSVGWALSLVRSTHRPSRNDSRSGCARARLRGPTPQGPCARCGQCSGLSCRSRPGSFGPLGRSKMHRAAEAFGMTGTRFTALLSDNLGSGESSHLGGFRYELLKRNVPHLSCGL